ncbi:MAG: nitroreductase family protein [Actinobacteria bacterium]|nr:MAG: nitroreductase family protein [Actinomycetota bacterium]
MGALRAGGGQGDSTVRGGRRGPRPRAQRAGERPPGPRAVTGSGSRARAHAQDLHGRERRGRPDGRGPTYASVYPAVQNLILAARGRGLATVLTTVYRVYEDELGELCGVPERYDVVALLPLGHPQGRWGDAARRPPGSLTSWNRFGERRG